MHQRQECRRVGEHNWGIIFSFWVGRCDLGATERFEMGFKKVEETVKLKCETQNREMRAGKEGRKPSCEDKPA